MYLFAKYTMLPLPIYDVKSISYYLDVLKPYYKATSLYPLYLEQLAKYRNEDLYKSTINALMDKIVNALLECEDFITFKNIDHTKIYKDQISDQILTSNKTIYTPENHKKYFVSIDIKAANFTIIKNYNKKAVLGFDTWNDFISSYTPDPFIQKSKYFREVVFGKAGSTKKTACIAVYYLNNLIKNLTNIGYNELSCVNSDEIIFEIDNPENVHTIETYVEYMYPNLFHVACYKLLQFPNKPFYIREHLIYHDNIKVDFKCIPKKLISNEILPENYHLKLYTHIIKSLKN